MHATHLLALVATLAATSVLAFPHASNAINTAQHNSYLAKHDDFVTHFRPPTQSKVLARAVKNENPETGLKLLLEFLQRKKKELFHSTQFKVHGFGKRDGIDEETIDGAEDDYLSMPGLFDEKEYNGEDSEASEPVQRLQRRGEEASIASAEPSKSTSPQPYTGSLGDLMAELGLFGEHDGGKHAPESGEEELAAWIQALALQDEYEHKHEHSRRSGDEMAQDSDPDDELYDLEEEVNLESDEESSAELQQRDLNGLITAGGKISGSGHHQSSPGQHPAAPAPPGHADLDFLRKLMAGLMVKQRPGQHNAAGPGAEGLLGAIAVAEGQHRHPKRDSDVEEQDDDESGLWSSGFSDGFFDETTESGD